MTWKIIKLSLKSIFNNKMRSFLTMLGIIIGVMAVVILVSITKGAASGITDSISDMGSQLITASVTDSETTVSAEDVESLSSYPAIESVAPVITASETVKKGSNTGNYSIVGITPDYFTVRDIDIQRGRQIADSDIEWNTSVCILGTEAATDLFGTWDAVNGTVIIGDSIYKVIGVLEEQGSSLTGSDDSKIFIPYSTSGRITGQKGVSSFYVKASGEGTVNSAVNSIEAFLLQATRDEEAYTVSNQSDVLDTMDDVTDTMSLLLAGIAAISLLVGGIGIMNIMLVSVTERTREIGRPRRPDRAGVVCLCSRILRLCRRFPGGHRLDGRVRRDRLLYPHRSRVRKLSRREGVTPAADRRAASGSLGKERRKTVNLYWQFPLSSATSADFTLVAIIPNTPNR